jgi:hypothetical protein
MNAPKLETRSPPATVPPCRDCSHPMRIVSVVPHDRFQNLDVRNFRCEVCGADTSDVVARVE